MSNKFRSILINLHIYLIILFITLFCVLYITEKDIGREPGKDICIHKLYKVLYSIDNFLHNTE